MWPTEFKSAMIMEIKDLIQLLPGFLDNDFHGTQNMLTHGLLHTWAGFNYALIIIKYNAGTRVSTVMMLSSAQFRKSRHLPINNLYSNILFNKTSSNSFWPFKDCKNPIFKVKFLREKSAESFWKWFSHFNMWIEK